MVNTLYFIWRARKSSRLKNLGPEISVRRSPSHLARSVAVEFATSRQPLLGFALSAVFLWGDRCAIAPIGLELRVVAVHLARKFVLGD